MEWHGNYTEMRQQLQDLLICDVIGTPAAFANARMDARRGCVLQRAAVRAVCCSVLQCFVGFAHLRCDW